MSLINQMLRDLEGRKREDASDAAEISVPGEGSRRRGSAGAARWLFVAIGLLGAVGIGLWLGQHLQNHTPAQPPQSTTAIAPAAPPATPAAKAPHAAAGPALAAVQLIRQNGREGLELHLSAPANFHFYQLADPPRWVLELDKVTGAPANLGAAALPKAVQKLSYSVASGGLQMVFAMARPTPAEAASVSPTRFTLWFGATPTVAGPVAAPPAAKTPTPASSGTTTHRAKTVPAEKDTAAATSEMVKVPRKATPGERAEQDYQDALRAARSGALAAATAALKHALAVKADYAPARQLLAQILLHQGHKAEATALLKEGLALGGNAKGRALLGDLYARILADDGKLGSAIALLSGLRPAVQEAPEHYALLAALEQRAGDYDNAAMLYKHLVELRPDSGVWWMGLGISLEHLNKPQQAMLAYRRAASSGSLEPAVQKFVDGRIAALSQ